MRWISLTDAAFGAVSTAGTDTASLGAECRAGRSIGVVTLGERHLFFRRLWNTYYIPYGSISRLFRRVLTVPAKIGCCSTGEIRVENLVICAVPGGGSARGTGSPQKSSPAQDNSSSPDEKSAQGGGERELAQIQLPGERAAKALMEELAKLAPCAVFGCPAKREEAGNA